MKLTTGIVALAMMVGGAAVAQNPDAIDNARKTVKSLQQQQAAKPTPAAAAAVVKPAALPAAKTAVKSTSKASDTNKLQHVNVVPGANDIQIEISSSQAVTPRVSKLSSPARVLVELPETVVASAQSKIPVGTGESRASASAWMARLRRRRALWWISIRRWPMRSLPVPREKRF